MKILKTIILNAITLCIISFSAIAQTSVPNTYKSFNVLSNKPDVDNGFWEATIEDNVICIDIIGEKAQSYIITKCFDKSDFNFNEENTSFELNRIQGKLSFTGEFSNNFGEGKFEFKRNEGFETFLEDEGIAHNNEIYFFKLFLSNVSKDYILNVKALNFEPSIVELGRLAYHNVELSYVKEMKALGYNLEEITMLAIHAINSDYIKSFTDLDINKPKAWEIKKAKMLDITADFIKKSIKRGFLSKDLGDYIKLKKKGKF